MTKITKKYTVLYEFSKEKGNFPQKITELMTMIIREQRKEKLKKINENENTK